MLDLGAPQAENLPQSAKPARVISVQSVSGGVGRSAIAANLAFELAATGARVALLDLDDAWPSLHRYFALPQQQAAVLAAMRLVSQQKLDSNSMEQLSVRLLAKGVGVDFLSGFGLGENRANLDADLLAGLLQTLRQRFDVLVLDTNPAMDSVTGAVVATLVDATALVTLGDAVSLGRLLDAEAKLRTAANTLLVVNRLRASALGARPEWQVQQLLRDRSVFRQAAVVPEDQAFDEALLRGLPLRQVAPKSRAAQAIAELAVRLG